LTRLATPETVVMSPLLEAADPLELEPIPEVPLREIRFEAGDLARLGWPESRVAWGVRLEEVPGGRGTSACYRGGAPRQYPVLVPVRPGDRVRVQRRLHTTASELDLQVLERRFPIAHPEVVNHPRDLESAVDRFEDIEGLLAIHGFPAPAPGTWSEAALDITTGADTRSLAIVFRAAAETLPGHTVEACLDELSVTRLEPTPAQELALLSRARPAPEDPSGIGLVQRGQLLRQRRFEASSGAAESAFEHRDALLALPPTVLRFALDVPEAARLTFATALAASSPAGSAARFAVRVEDGAAGAVLFEGTLEGGPSPAWREVALDLGPWAGHEVDLVLETRSAGGPPGHALWGSPIVDRPRRPGEPPNVVLLGLDTLRADRLGSYGYGRPTSPHLDSLAQEGIRFDQAVSASSWTAPSFASVFTGLVPSRHGVVDRLSALGPGAETLAERLRDAGWRTQAIAYKAFLYNLGFEQGFDVWFNLPRLDRSAADGVRRALAFLDANAGRRFFLFLHFDDTHQPMRQPEPFATRFVPPETLRGLGIDLPVNVGRPGGERCRDCRASAELQPGWVEAGGALYDGAVAFLDHELGVLFEGLEERGLWEDTLVVAVSDHGEALWDRGGEFGHGFQVSDEVVRAVLIVKPHRGARLPAGSVVRTQVRTTDLAPTLLELAGLEAGPATPESGSLLPLLRAAAPAGDRVAVSENVRLRLAAVRLRDWKYVVRHQPAVPARESLYDLTADPGELVDLARERQERLATMRRLLAEHVLRNRAGRYALLVGDGLEHRWRCDVRLGGEVPRLTPLFGRGPTTTGGTWIARDRLLGLAELGGSGPGRAQLEADGAAVAAATGFVVAPSDPALFLDELLRRPGAQVVLVEVSGDEAAAEAVSRENVEQREQLRALGYVE
jgi:arylsulfatase A-like enzyme